MRVGTLLWIFTGHNARSATLTLNGSTYPGVQRGMGAYQFTTSGTGVTTSSVAFVTYTGAEQPHAVVTISHCTGGGTPTTTVPTTQITHS